MQRNIRTDLAVESDALWQKNADETARIEGVRAETKQKNGFTVTTVEILSEAGERALGKPMGKYITVDLDAFLRREENAFAEACDLLAQELCSFHELEISGNYLVVGLGNRGITPDAIGPETVDRIMVTRHLKQRLPDDFAAFQPVSAACSGVLGTTALESSALVHAIVEKVHPSLVIAVDALASRAPDRLCRSVQIADTGIVPGSGVGNARQCLNHESLGVPVLAIGVPTVVDAATLALDLAARSGAELDPAAFGEVGGMIVTPRDIDKNVKDIAKLIGYSINLALHKGLTLEDVDMFLS